MIELLSLQVHNPVARAARAPAGRYTGVCERGDRPNFEPRARAEIYGFSKALSNAGMPKVLTHFQAKKFIIDLRRASPAARARQFDADVLL